METAVMPKIKCGDVECKYNSKDNYCTADETVILTAHSVMTVLDGRQQFWKCKNFAVSDEYREIEEKFKEWMKKHERISDV